MAPSEESLPEPLVIPRAEHPISRKNIDREALKVMYRLRDAGYSAYLVGGGVRDLYLGKQPKDFDISTNARPGQLRKLFRNSRIIGRRFRLVQVFFPGNKIIEVSTLRCRSEFDIDKADEVLASNNTFGSEPEDAFRRDLTINALFYEIEHFTILDYVGGVKDLNDKVVRIVGDPNRRIVRDPVRMLRAVRHAARSGFTIEEESWQAIVAHRDKLRLCPVSRIRDELFKDLHGHACAPWCRLAIASGIFAVLFPFYEEIIAPQDLDGDDSAQPCSLLLALLTIVDRLHVENQEPLPEHILLTLLMLPWALKKFDLMNLNLKGHEAFNLSRQIRADLDSLLEHLSIKRASKEDITSLLVNLPVFARHDQDKGWPKWLSRKSYFSDGKLLLQILREAQGGPAVSMRVEVAKQAKPAPRTRKRSGKRRSSRSPAYARKKGGIFGLNKG